jgi:hypothetical protein
MPRSLAAPLFSITAGARVLCRFIAGFFLPPHRASFFSYAAKASGAVLMERAPRRNTTYGVKLCFGNKV